MKLTVLGSGTCVPSVKRGGPGLLVKAGESSILIDSGLGSLHKLLRLGLSYLDIDYLCYTHIHPDHTAELVPFLFTCNYGESLRKKPLTIIGSPGFAQFFDQLSLVYTPWLEALNYSLEIVKLQETQWQGPDFVIKSVPVQHSPQSIAYRIESKERSLVISGDTDYCPQINKLAQDCNLLVLECAFPDEKKVAGHLTPYLAGKIAQEANCKQLLLTHFYPVCEDFPIKEQCQKVFSGEVFIAEDFFQIKI